MLSAVLQLNLREERDVGRLGVVESIDFSRPGHLRLLHSMRSVPVNLKIAKCVKGYFKKRNIIILYSRTTFFAAGIA